MAPETILIPGCWGLIIVLGLVVLVPFLRGTSDLVTAKNVFLLGGINYVGIAGLKAAYSPQIFRILEFERRDYQYFVAGAFTFFAAFLLAYAVIKLPRKLAGRTLRKWPAATPGVLYFMTLGAVTLSVLGFLAPNIQGLAQFLFQVGNKAIIIPVALVFAAWFQSKKNLILVATLAGVLLLSMMLSILSGGGRRTMLGVLMAIPICWYWFSLRYKNWLTNTVLLGAVFAVSFAVLLGYSAIRHFDRRGEMQERNVGNAMEALSKLPSLVFDTSGLDSMLGQNAAQTSLTAIHLYTTDHETEPFHSVIFVATNWIPRAFWPDKPLGLGYTLPKTARAKGTRATWGPGIVGHGYHEGGLHMLVFYGVVMALCLRYWDELLVRQPRNAYLLACFAAMSGHLFGWCRGDIGTFTMQIVGALVAMLLFCWAGRLIFGTGLVYPITSGPEYVNTNLFALRRRKPDTASPTDFQFRPRRVSD
ncbi:hypothetical protein NG895_04710 [Aeoliella sp. ICT_H6.2]|uniref:Uncharacterized protein n=1 Tax=Aeoliella straminimaris TaxID=2954799 RepID=A0A9X2JG68_9BACT|nr:hypothetical protein [Aeoliella straminimaris]MCO6043198.1 hypothetical protein [Aeoliella straminimaris]